MDILLSVGAERPVYSCVERPGRLTGIDDLDRTYTSRAPATRVLIPFVVGSMTVNRLDSQSILH
jgi:hypothetical protein